MAITYEESATLMNDTEFRGRVKVSALKIADSIMLEPITEPAHNTRLRWATSTFQNPEQSAMTLHPPTVMDPAVQDAGLDENGKSLVSDEALKGAVQASLNKML